MDLIQPSDDLSLLFPLPDNGTIFVISGWRGVGKTTYCHKSVDLFLKAGLKVSGLLSPGRFENNQRNGMLTIDLATKESQLLASLVPGEIQGPHFGPWTFDNQVFEWGNHRLLQSAGTDVLVIDELGFLEFNLNTGWTSSFEILHKKGYWLAMVVIRPECVDAFSAMGFNFQIKEVISPHLPLHLKP
jgi:nucleoside-triphosphatase THEP1